MARQGASAPMYVVGYTLVDWWTQQLFDAEQTFDPGDATPEEVEQLVKVIPPETLGYISRCLYRTMDRALVDIIEARYFPRAGRPEHEHYPAEGFDMD